MFAVHGYIVLDGFFVRAPVAKQIHKLPTFETNGFPASIMITISIKVII